MHEQSRWPTRAHGTRGLVSDLCTKPSSVHAWRYLHAAEDVEGALPLGAARQSRQQVGKCDGVRLAAPAAHELEDLQAPLPAPDYIKTGCEPNMRLLTSMHCELRAFPPVDTDGLVTSPSEVDCDLRDTPS